MMTHRDLETLAQEKTNKPLDLDQLRQDWAELEEDDESVFYPIALYDKSGREYQSFTMFRRSDVVDQNYEQKMIWDDRPDGIEFWPMEVQHMDGAQERTVLTMYKRVDKKIRPVSTTFSPEYEVRRCIPEDPM
jgi:hypothetical protein